MGLKAEISRRDPFTSVSNRALPSAHRPHHGNAPPRPWQELYLKQAAISPIIHRKVVMSNYQCTCIDFDNREDLGSYRFQLAVMNV